MAKKVIDSTYLVANLQNLVSDFLDFRYLKVVSELPASANSNIVFLYIGETIDTEQLKCYKGGLYNYNNGWVEIPNRLSAEVAKKQNKTLETALVVSGSSYTTVEDVLSALNNSKLDIATTEPSEPADGDIIMYIGAATVKLPSKGIYVYNANSSKWNNLIIFGDYLPLTGGNLTGDVSVNLSGDASKPYIKTDYEHGGLHIDSKTGYSVDYKIPKIVRTQTSNTYEYNYPDKSGTFVITNDDGNTDLGSNTIENGVLRSVAEGYTNTLVDNWTDGCHVEGFNNVVSGSMSHAEGSNNSVTESYSHVEGKQNTVSAERAHAEGYNNTVSALYGHAEGGATTASGEASHAEGTNNLASGARAHAEGGGTEASGENSHAQNNNTVAGYDSQTAMGKFNNNKSTNLLEVGNGTDDNNRSNAMEVTADGDLLIKNGGVSLYGLDENKEVLGAKNLLPLTLDNLKAINTAGTWSGNAYTRNGVTFTILTDNDGNVTGIKVNGTATGSIEFYITTIIENTFGHDICNGSQQATPKILISYFEGTTWRGEQYQYNNSNSVIFGTDDYPNRTHIRFVIYMAANDSCNNVTIYPMIRLATDPNPTYRPYAMSNQELTQRLLALEARLSSNINSIELET